MGTAYTPGLIVAPQTTLRKSRNLPTDGQVLVEIGQQVDFDTVVARAELPGNIFVVRASQQLDIEPSRILKKMLVEKGRQVKAGQIIALSTHLFGLLRSQAVSPAPGTVELVSEITGHVEIRQDPKIIEMNAYVSGRVVETLPGRGIVVETSGAHVQGIFGIGPETHGQVLTVGSQQEDIRPEDITKDAAGKILLGRWGIGYEAMKQAIANGAVGAVIGCMEYGELYRLLGEHIGVAITGQERVGLTLVVTEGFGRIPMAKRTFELLDSLSGREAAINGATQIRAGVMRPEVIVPLAEPRAVAADIGVGAQQLEIGRTVRVIRQPWFGQLGKVVELPAEQVVIATGSRTRVVKLCLESGEQVSLPRANVEIIV